MSAVGETVKAALGHGPPAAQRTRQRARFLAHARGARARLLRELSVGVLAASLGAVAMYLGWQQLHPVGLVAPERVGAAFVFNEASRVELAPGTRAHVESASGHAAVVVLDSGQLTCAITSGLKNLWRFRAGPHEAIVRGTKFVLGWNPANEALGLTVSEGKVEVRLEGGAVAFVTPGHPLSVQQPHGPEKVMQLDEMQLDVMQLDELSLDDVPAAKQASRRAVKKLPAQAFTAPPEFIEPDDKRALVPEWKRQAEAGRYAKAVALVEEQGVDVALAGVSGDDLLLFADAARLTRQAALGRTALHRVRDRFKGTLEAAEAAFRLGRLEFDAHHFSEAGEWFDTYVREAPSGAFIAEAMGRRVDAWQRGPDARVAKAASEYLEKYPKGAYAPIARAALSNQ